MLILALIAINQAFTSGRFRRNHRLESSESTANAWQVFALSVVRPGLCVTALLSLLLTYIEFLLSLVLTGPATKTLPMALAELRGGGLNYWTLSAATAVGIMLPIAVFMMLSQRHLLRGLPVDAVKG